MHTIHSLYEMQMTSCTPTIHVPRELVRDLGPDGHNQLINALEAAGAREQPRSRATLAWATRMYRHAVDDTLVGLLEGIVVWWRRRRARPEPGPLAATDARA